MTSLIVARQSLGYLILFYFVLYCVSVILSKIYIKQEHKSAQSVVSSMLHVKSVISRLGVWLCGIFLVLHIAITIWQIKEVF